ncbi:MAG: hypothetical protein QG620_533 [Patescibacteria group bacterium]|nr:hypothetical protein [Patescibacteria group bacterium]
MNKIPFLLLATIAALVFSGCSLAPGGVQKAQEEKAYTFSKVIWKSADGGKTWEAKNKINKKPRVADPDILILAINPQNSNQIYAGLKSGGIMKTENGGESWEFSEIFTSEKVYGLALDPVEPRIIYASAVYQGRGKIFKSEDAGATWQEIYTSAADGPLIISLTVDNQNRNAIYATASDGAMIKSFDGGQTWKNIFESKSPILKVAIDSDDSNLAYFILQGGGIWRSRNAGESFEDITGNISKKEEGESARENKSLNGRSFDFIKADPKNSGWLYLAGSGGIIRSRDAGDNWEVVPALNNPQSFPVKALAINPANSNGMLYGASQAAYKSEDSGESWSTFQFDTKKKIRIMEFDPSNPSVVYLGLSE